MRSFAQAPLSQAGKVMRTHHAAQQTLPRRVTARKQQMLCLVDEGKRHQEIAAALYLSEGIVKLRLHHIYKKLGLDSRSALPWMRRNMPSSKDLRERLGREKARTPVEQGVSVCRGDPGCHVSGERAKAGVQELQ